jgi:hypothetical protein
LNETVGALCTSLPVALAVSALSSVLFILFDGAVCNYPSIPAYLRWLFWISPCAYSTSAMSYYHFEYAIKDDPTSADAQGNKVRERKGTGTLETDTLETDTAIY